MNKMVAVRELQLGDRVQVFPGAYGCATVIEANFEHVVLLRPHVVIQNFSYCGGRVLHSLGWEEIAYRRTSPATFTLLRRERMPIK